jgi:acyl-coenzyme A synthetase/AMP-(fatty) acid ligase
VSTSSPGRTRSRPLNRTRFLLDRRVTPATVLDSICESHPDSAILSPVRPLPYPGLGEGPISPAGVLSFAARAGEVLQLSGMGRGDRVAIFKRNEVDYAFLALAVIRAGGVAVPVNPGMSVDTLDRYLRYTGVETLCCDRHLFTATIGDRSRLPTIRHWVFTDEAGDADDGATVLRRAIAEVPGDVRPVSLGDDSQTVLAHTSGTTGMPKAVVCTARSLLNGIRVHYRTEPPLPWRRVGIAGPFSHLVFQIGVTTALISNLPAWALDGRKAGPALEAIERERINLFVAFPELYLKMYAHGLGAHDLDSMRVWISVADSSQEAHMAAFCSRGAVLRVARRTLFGSVFVETLGSSEIGGPALRRIWTSRSRIRCRRQVGRRMLGGPRVKIADRDGRPVPAGRAGALMVKGPTLFAGYWTAEGRLDDARTDGWWATGDVVRGDRFGRVHHLDRTTDVIHTAAGPFYSLPAEDVLHTYPGVSEAVVFGVSAPSGGEEEPVGLVWPAPSASLDEAELLRWANQRVDGPVGLAAVRSVSFEEIPRGLTGKVLKRRLRETYAAHA